MLSPKIEQQVQKPKHIIVTPDERGNLVYKLVDTEDKQPGSFVVIEYGAQGWIRENPEIMDIFFGTGEPQLQYLTRGGQSAVYLLRHRGRELVLKQEAPPLGSRSIAIPYHIQLIQVQIIRKDLGNVLERLGVYLPDFLCASPTLCVQPFYDGQRPVQNALRNLAEELDACLSDYLAWAQKRGDTLWSGVKPDIIRGKEVRVDNFVFTYEGDLVLLDPFYHY